MTSLSDQQMQYFSYLPTFFVGKVIKIKTLVQTKLRINTPNNFKVTH